MDGRPKRNNKVAFSDLSGLVWTGPYFQSPNPTGSGLNNLSRIFEILLYKQLINHTEKKIKHSFIISIWFPKKSLSCT